MIRFVREIVGRRTLLCGSAMSFSNNCFPKQKVLFCSDKFPHAFKFTKQELSKDRSIEVAFCTESRTPIEIADASVAIPGMCILNKSVIEQAKNLRMIIQYGAGLEGVDIPYASSKGIWVSNIPTYATANAISCAEHVIYLALSLLRQQKKVESSLRERKLGLPIGQTLEGNRILIIGFGGIAKKLIPLFKPFNVLFSIDHKIPDWADRFMSQFHADYLGMTIKLKTKLITEIDQTCVMSDLPDILPNIDFIVLACPVNDSSKGMINASFLDSCKDGVRIINVCRGGLLNEQDTLHYLKEGKIGGLGLDVYWREPIDPEDELLQHPNVVVTPHIAGVTESSYKDMAKIIAREVYKINSGQEPSIIINKHLLKTDLQASP